MKGWREIEVGGFSAGVGFRTNTEGEFARVTSSISVREVCLVGDFLWFGYYLGWVNREGKELTRKMFPGGR